MDILDNKAHDNYMKFQHRDKKTQNLINIEIQILLGT